MPHQLGLACLTLLRRRRLCDSTPHPSNTIAGLPHGPSHRCCLPHAAGLRSQTRQKTPHTVLRLVRAQRHHESSAHSGQCTCQIPKAHWRRCSLACMHSSVLRQCTSYHNQMDRRVGCHCVSLTVIAQRDCGGALVRQGCHITPSLPRPTHQSHFTQSAHRCYFSRT